MLQSIVPGAIWCAQQAIKIGPFDVRTRMTVVRLADGGLWVHSPISPSASIIEQLATIGDVRYVLAPNKSHHLFLVPFLNAFPHATGFIAPGLAEKRADLSSVAVLQKGMQQPWERELAALFVEGIPALNETVWFHWASGTLIVTDLLFQFGADNPFAAKVVARMLGVYERLGMSRTMKLLVKDRQALARTVDRLLQWPVKRVVLAHDSIVELQATDQLAEAFRWLRE